MLKEYPVVMSFRNPKPTPFHPILGDSPSSVLGTDTRGMDGLQVAIMEYKTAYASWKISNVSGNAASTDRLRESIDVREAILGEMLCAVSAHHLDTHRFGYFQNTTLHLAAFYEDASLIGRLIMQNPDPFIRNGMGLLPIDATYSDPVRQVLETYMNRYHQQQRRRPNPGQQQQQPRRQQQQQHDPNLDLAAYYAQQQIDSQQASYFYNSQLAAHHAEVSSHSSDEENSISSGSHNIGHDGNRCKPMHTEGPIHRQLGRAAVRQDSIAATAISEPSAEEDASGSGRDYSYHLQSIPSRLSTLIEVSCEDEVSSISDILSDHGTMHAGHRRNSILSGPSMDPISEIAEAAIENDPYINHTNDGGRSNVGRSSSTSNLQQ
ncbi:hypothetical protein EV182_005820 [Spiromyces aspiralis]|uniref:Uncharacterized protein n=1 Tax=Spiromyces aspiralis TaxID=68401 RepID=A0ACC1HQS7_9FUNG|nr:hypothetical protein EV182_005820 [Spiromyces aspiralis]